jgi:hypothetical protein
VKIGLPYSIASFFIIGMSDFCTGSQGSEGFPGIQGLNGMKGERGDYGESIPGPPGDMGMPGDAGPQGRYGVPGMKGLNGDMVSTMGSELLYLQLYRLLKYTIMISLQKTVFCAFRPYWGWTQSDGGSTEPSDH